MFRKCILPILLLASGGAVAASVAQQPERDGDWLVGTWILCEDPDKSPKDSLQFNQDGTGLVIRAKGNIEFLHRHSGASVSLLANANGYAIPIELSASPEFDKLLLHSEKTGNTSSYIRADNPEAGNCSVKWTTSNNSFKPKPLRGSA